MRNPLTPEDAKMLGKITTRDEHGRHFTEVYDQAWLDRMEKAGMIEISRPVHAETGLAYSQDQWSLTVSGLAIDLGESCNWGEAEISASARILRKCANLLGNKISQEAAFFLRTTQIGLEAESSFEKTPQYRAAMAACDQALVDAGLDPSNPPSPGDEPAAFRAAHEKFELAADTYIAEALRAAGESEAADLLLSDPEEFARIDATGRQFFLFKR